MSNKEAWRSEGASAAIKGQPVPKPTPAMSDTQIKMNQTGHAGTKKN